MSWRYTIFFGAETAACFVEAYLGQRTQSENDWRCSHQAEDNTRIKFQLQSRGITPRIQCNQSNGFSIRQRMSLIRHWKGLVLRIWLPFNKFPEETNCLLSFLKRRSWLEKKLFQQRLRSSSLTFLFLKRLLTCNRLRQWESGQILSCSAQTRQISLWMMKDSTNTEAKYCASWFTTWSSELNCSHFVAAWKTTAWRVGRREFPHTRPRTPENWTQIKHCQNTYPICLINYSSVEGESC